MSRGRSCDSLAYSTTVQIAAAIRAREVSASEVLEAHLAQIAAVNPALNAVVTVDEPGARARALQADQALARGEAWGPLHGVPFTLKDAHSTAGMRTTIGFPPLADHRAQEDGAVAARLKRAGGVLVGKTNVAMLLGDYQTSNPVFGRTNNPWDLRRTPGGSSGGAAAALAAGMTPFEIGTDLSASIRIPAHCCGVFGLKPTENRVPTTGLFPDPSGAPRAIRVMTTIGPMARSAEDLELLYGIIAGPDGCDTEAPPVPVENAPIPAIKTLRIAVALTFPGFPVAADIRDTVERVARDLDRAGARVEAAPLPSLDFSQDLSSAGALIGMMIGAFQPGEGTPPATLPDYLEALHRRDRSIVAWESFFRSWDALLCPASMTTAFPHCATGAPIALDGEPVSYWMIPAHGALFNYSGHPAVVTPCGLDRGGLPIGLQLVGRRWSEARLLAIAQALTPLTGGFRRPSAYECGPEAPPRSFRIGAPFPTGPATR
jgi:amidase